MSCPVALAKGPRIWPRVGTPDTLGHPATTLANVFKSGFQLNINYSSKTNPLTTNPCLAFIHSSFTAVVHTLRATELL